MLPVPFLIGSFGQIFFFCELSERITKQFVEVDEEICNSHWYKLPIDIQKMYPMIIIGSQKPVSLYGLGNIECSREAFKNVNS